MSQNAPKCKKTRCVKDQPPDRPTDIVTYRVACTRLNMQELLQYHSAETAEMEEQFW